VAYEARSWNHLAGTGPTADAAPGARHAAERRARLLALVEACPHRGPVHSEGCACLRACLAGKGRAGLVMATGETLTTDEDCFNCPGLVSP
jgi:hypothetical protein